jgi:uncharacterized protein
VSWDAGEVVVYRHRSYDGRYLSGLPLTIVEHAPDRIVGYLPHGTIVSRPSASNGADLRSIPLAERWRHPRVGRVAPFTLLGADGAPGRLIVVFPRDEAYAIWIFRDPSRVHGWYVNLEDPQVLGERTISSRDHVLDIWVPSETGETQWKDADELEASVAAGIRTEAEAQAIRIAGERVMHARPWPTGYEDVEPDPAWPLPQLFDGWDLA